MTRVPADLTISWRSVDDASEWTPLAAFPHPNVGFRERAQYWISKPSDSFSFHIDDEPLKADCATAVDAWTWTPRFFAGEVTASLVGADGFVAGTYLLDVSPDPTKLGRDVYEQMLKHLWAADPSLVIGFEPATTSIGELGVLENPWLAFSRLRRHFPQFRQALRAVQARPRRALRPKRQLLHVHRVRRVDRRTAMVAMRSPAAAWINARHNSDDIAESRLDVSIVEETVDSAANRCLFALTQGLLRRASKLSALLQAAVDQEKDSDTRTALASRWPVRRQFLTSTMLQLRAVLQRPPFSLVRRAEVTAAGLTAIAADPSYARAWSCGWRALKHGVDSAAEVDRLWISPSWEIYERWCFVRVGEMLRSALPEWNWHFERQPFRWTAESAGRCATLALQPTFRSQPNAVADCWSISRERVPDMVLTVTGEHGQRFIVFDAKYRTSRQSVLEGMESAHIYQDSLRIGSRRADASLLLVPSGGGAPWLENATFHEEHRVGIHPLAPGDRTTLPACVVAMLNG